jgi:hypothetical protein
MHLQVDIPFISSDGTEQHLAQNSCFMRTRQATTPHAVTLTYISLRHPRPSSVETGPFLIKQVPSHPEHFLIIDHNQTSNRTLFVSIPSK